MIYAQNTVFEFNPRLPTFVLFVSMRCINH